MMQSSSSTKPRIGVLTSNDLPGHPSGCYGLLCNYYEELAAKGLCSVQLLGQVALSKGARVSWESEPIDRARPSPGPLPETVGAQKFDGLIAMQISSPQYLTAIAKLGIPLVVLDFQPMGVECDSVVFDGIKAGWQIGQHLTATGHRNILFAALYNRDRTARPGADEFIEDDASVDRRTGILTGIEGTPCTLWPTLPLRSAESDEDLKKRISRYLGSVSQAPDCLSGHDVHHVGRVAALMEQLGVKVPAQLSLLSVGSDPPFSEFAEKISHLQFSWREMAVAGWTLLKSRLTDRQLRHAPPRVEKLTGKFIDHGSVVDRTRPRASL